jgi:nucleoside-diphosphate-sugar epimerase
MSRILVTGAAGFIGGSLVPLLVRNGNSVLSVVRRKGAAAALSETVLIDDLRALPAWDGILKNVDAVVHLAARAHVVAERSSDPIAAFRSVNVLPTIALFEACQRNGVSRFLFLSSIGVNGVATAGCPFTEASVPNPTEPYAVSKWEAEKALFQRVGYGATELVVIRPTLIYGPNAKGNFLRLMRWVDRGFPLPFGGLTATRSFLGVSHICELIDRCLSSPLAANQLFLAADQQAVSTKDFIAELARAMNRKPRFVNLPPKILLALGSWTGKRSEAERLVVSLEVDPSKAKQLLGWEASSSLGDMQSMVREYLGQRNAVG